MISDNETTKVYFSNLSVSDFKPELEELKKILNVNGIVMDMINGTRDYFCRDYMPVQVDKEALVRFKFRPDYLLKDPADLKCVTNANLVFRRNDFLKSYRIVNSDIILDGGNVVKYKTRAIITDKVFKDNPQIPEQDLKKQLETLLDVQVIIVPRYPDEPTGHSDGLVRIVDENTVLTIKLKNEFSSWRDKFLQMLHDAGLKVISLPALPHYSKDNWVYINFLWVKDLIIVPALHELNDPVIEQFFNETFPGCKIRMVKANRILKEGGGLNCLTWNVSSTA